MTDRSKLLALADAVEKLTGPNRETMYAAFDACLLRRTNFERQDVITWTREWLRFQNLVNAEAWLDAAKLLVPKGMDWSAGTQTDLGDGKLGWGNISPGGVAFSATAEINAEAATPALALCAAALRAQAEALA